MNALSCGRLWVKSIKHFGDYERHFSLATYTKSSQQVRACATGDGAICSKNRKLELSHIMGTAPIVELARAYGLHPRLWLLVLDNCH